MNNLYPNNLKVTRGHTQPNRSERRGTSEKVTRIKLNPKGITLKGVNILIISAIFLAIAVFVVALTDEELEAEKALLEGELIDDGYDWLVKGGVKW